MGIRRREHATDEELSLLIDGMLDERTARRVQAHVRQCDACRQRYEALQQTVVLLQKVPRVSVPRAFTLTEADVASHARRKGRAMPWMRWATALVAAMLVVVVGLDLVTMSIVGTSGAPAPQPRGAFQAERVPPSSPSAQQAKPALAPAVRATGPQPLLRAQGAESEAAASPTAQPTAVQETNRLVQPKGMTSEEPPSTQETRGWPWYRWAEIVLSGLLLVLLIFQVVLQ